MNKDYYTKLLRTFLAETFAAVKKPASTFDVLAGVDLTLAGLLYQTRDAMVEDGYARLRGLLEDLRLESIFQVTADEELHDALFALVRPTTDSGGSSNNNNNNSPAEVLAWLKDHAEMVRKDLEVLSELLVAILSVKNFNVEDWADVLKYYVVNGLNYHVVQQTLVAFFSSLSQQQQQEEGGANAHIAPFVKINFISS